MNPLADERITFNDGTTIPALGLGTFEQTGEHCTKVVEWALEVGYRAVDTAQAYYNQPQIAPALKKVPRSELFITSKLWREFCAPDDVIPSIDKTLQELEIDTLDLMLLHWPIKEIPIEETMGQLHKAQEQGKIRSLGVSNCTIRHLKDVMDAGIPIVTNQVELHPYLIQPALMEFCKQHKIAITAYSPLARGAILNEPVVQKIAAAHGKTAAQTAIRWSIQMGAIVIPKSSSKERLKENGDVFDFTLTPEEMGEIAALNRDERTIFPDFNEFDYR